MVSQEEQWGMMKGSKKRMGEVWKERLRKSWIREESERLWMRRKGIRVDK